MELLYGLFGRLTTLTKSFNGKSYNSVEIKLTYFIM